jgi:CRISPR/Cas system endoribonuclease Cas6 (RAMP superfamily)
MNAYAMFAADEALRVTSQRLADLRRESRNQRLVAANGPRSSFAGVVGSALASVRSAFAPVEDQAPALPALADYPYRS